MGRTKLKCFYINARSIVSKTDELELYVLEEKPDIVESWATNLIDDADANLEGYTMLRKDRVFGTKIRADGVLLFFKNSLKLMLY